MKYFVKFCESKYNITKDCKTICLGTLSYYNKLEGKRGDPSEGIIEHGIPPGTDLIINSGESVNILGEEWASAGDQPGRILVGENGKFGTDINVNCYVYCLSHIDESQINLDYGKERFGDEIDSFFVIAENRIGFFVNYLSMLLTHSLQLSDFNKESNELIKNEILKGQFGIRFIHQPVTYVNKKFSDSRTDIEEDKILNRLLFEKEMKYKGDNEFRIALLPLWGNNILSCKPENKLLTLLPNIFHTL
jgi:hypothetical protein